MVPPSGVARCTSRPFAALEAGPQSCDSGRTDSRRLAAAVGAPARVLTVYLVGGTARPLRGTEKARSAREGRPPHTALSAATRTSARGPRRAPPAPPIRALRGHGSRRGGCPGPRPAGEAPERVDELEHRDGLASADVDRPADIGRGRGEVGLDDVAHVDVVARLAAVAEDRRALAG